MSEYKTAFAMTIGPGEAEMAIDTMEGILALYPKAEIWVRDDATTDGTFDRVTRWSAGKPVRVSRNDSSYGYYRIAQTFGKLLLEVAPSRPDLLIKLDPDTVLLRPGLIELFQQRFAKYGPGICGSYKTSANGSPRDFSGHRKMMMIDLLPVGPVIKLRKLRWGPVSYAKHIIRAMSNGYSLGENVQGGLYAIDGDTLQRMERTGFLNAASSGRRGMVWTEDVMLTMGAKAVGGNISPLNEDGGPKLTHIQAVRPLPVEAMDGTLLAVHPVKKEDAALRVRLKELVQS